MFGLDEQTREPEFRQRERCSGELVAGRTRILGADHLDTLGIRQHFASCHPWLGEQETASDRGLPSLNGSNLSVGHRRSVDQA